MTKEDLRLLQKLLDRFYALHGLSENDDDTYSDISTMISDVFKQIHNE